MLERVFGDSPIIFFALPAGRQASAKPRDVIASRAALSDRGRPVRPGQTGHPNYGAQANKYNYFLKAWLNFLTSLDFFRSRVFFLITPFCAALSRAIKVLATNSLASVFFASI